MDAQGIDRVIKPGSDQTDVVSGVGGQEMVCGSAADQGFAVHQRPLKGRDTDFAGQGDNKKFYAYYGND